MLRGPRLPHAIGHRHHDEFDVRRGDELTYSMTWVPSHQRTPGPHGDTVEQTIDEQSQWVTSCDLSSHGDAVHFTANWDAKEVPGGNFDKQKTSTSMAKMADLIAKDHATLWINHDKPQREKLKLAPEFFE